MNMTTAKAFGDTRDDYIVNAQCKYNEYRTPVMVRIVIQPEHLALQSRREPFCLEFAPCACPKTWVEKVNW